MVKFSAGPYKSVDAFPLYTVLVSHCALKFWIKKKLSCEWQGADKNKW